MSGHRIENVPLTEYQMSPLAPARDIRWETTVARLNFMGLVVIVHDQNQLGGDDLSGKVKLNVEPLPTGPLS